MRLWASARQGDALNQAFASLALYNTSSNDHVSFIRDSIDTVPPSQEPRTAKELSTIMMAMRKIREAIVASSRLDTFALRTYLFVIRATILTKQMESYHPALLHLLRRIHPSSPMSSSEEHEFVGYYILDLACRQDDLAAAYEARNTYKYRDTRIEMVLHALAHDNWCIFWKIQRLVDGYQKRLMEWGEDRMRRHALKCLGRGYLSAEKAYIEKVAGRDWEELQKKDKVGWELNEDMVTIRRIRRT